MLVAHLTENDGPKVIDAELTITDEDDANIASATVTISSGFQSSEDVLAFTDTNDINGSWNQSTGILTLSGSATKAKYEAALESVTYNNTSENPNTTDRTISWQINDGTANSSAVTSTISLASVNDAPYPADPDEYPGQRSRNQQQWLFAGWS